MMHTTYYETLPIGDALIRVMRVEPEDAPKGVVQFVHGFGEHIGMYDALAGFFAEHGYAFVIHDQRGHGEMRDKTPTQREKALGVVPSYVYFLTDITAIRQKIDDWFPDLPVTLAGLSMGGNIVANYLERMPAPRFVKAIIESPWLRLAKPLPGVVTEFARVVGSFTPNLAIPAGLNLDAITRDPGETEKMKTDPFYHGRISFKLYSQILDAGEYAIAHAAEIKLPTLLMTGTGDRIVSVDAIRELANNAGLNVTLVEYDGAFHALHQETNRAEVMSAMLAFCNKPANLG
jgi:lysophospholipase